MTDIQSAFFSTDAESASFAGADGGVEDVLDEGAGVFDDEAVGMGDVLLVAEVVVVVVAAAVEPLAVALVELAVAVRVLVEAVLLALALLAAAVPCRSADCSVADNWLANCGGNWAMACGRSCAIEAGNGYRTGSSKCWRMVFCS